MVDPILVMLPSTGIEEISAGIGQLRDLVGLQMDNCPLRNPFNKLYGKEALLLVHIFDSHRTSLDLSKCNLDTIPGAVLQQRALEVLDLSGNNIQV